MKKPPAVIACDLRISYSDRAAATYAVANDEQLYLLNPIFKDTYDRLASEKQHYADESALGIGMGFKSGFTKIRHAKKTFSITEGRIGNLEAFERMLIVLMPYFTGKPYCLIQLDNGLFIEYKTVLDSVVRNECVLVTRGNTDIYKRG